MDLQKFRVTNYRNVLDSDWIDVTRITGLVGQNESGKSNLCEALYRLNPFEAQENYNINEDWPADRWGEREPTAPVCEAIFLLDAKEVRALFEYATVQHPQVAGNE